MDKLIVAGNINAMLVPRTYVHRRNGQTLQVKIPESMLRDYEISKRRLCVVAGKNPSQSIIVRRALDLYLRDITKLTDRQLEEESLQLMKHR
jgi:hypothetical protein